MKINGAFLCFGTQLEPCVILLDEVAHKRLDEQLRVAAKHGKSELRHDAYKKVFRADVQWAIPCWIESAMVAVSDEYRGLHEERVRGLAACIATGTPYGINDSNHDDEGGKRAALVPESPAPKQPGGAAVQLMFSRAAA